MTLEMTHIEIDQWAKNTFLNPCPPLEISELQGNIKMVLEMTNIEIDKWAKKAFLNPCPL